MADPTYVRVRDKSTGHEFSMIEAAVDKKTVDVLDENPLDHNGDPLEPKYASKTALKAAADKESAK